MATSLHSVWNPAQRVDVRFGSLADIFDGLAPCPLCAESAHCVSIYDFEADWHELPDFCLRITRRNWSRHPKCVPHLRLRAMSTKDRATPEDTERAYPHVVELLVPYEGFDRELAAMHQFHARHGIQAQRGRSRRENGGDYIRWCFADPGVAAEFADEFGGTIGQQHTT